MPRKKEKPEKPPKPKPPARKPLRPGKGKDEDAGGKQKGISVKGGGSGEHPTATTESKDGLSVRSGGSGEHPT